MREGESAWHKRIRKSIKLNQWKGLIRGALKTPWSSGDKKVLLDVGKQDGKEIHTLVTDPMEVKSRLRTFFES